MSYQPPKDESILINERVRSETQLISRNYLLRDKRGNKKIECAEPGCETNINRWQKEKCMMHESKESRVKADQRFYSEMKKLKSARG